MKARRWWIGTIGGGVLGAAALGGFVYRQYGRIDEARNEVAGLRGNIESSRRLIEGTPSLEREVIVLRELSEVMQRILPDTEDVNNLVRTFQKFSEDSGVRISGLKKKQNDARDKGDFDRVAYTLSLEADAFQFMDFLDLIESHSRFMRVPNFHITAAMRNQAGERPSGSAPAHKMQVDVETFVYEPRKDSKAVKIDAFDRKRDLLLGEVARRRAGLSVSSFTYHGSRGRRDPWIDPRVPVLGDGESSLTVQEQMDLVQEMCDRMQQALSLWDQYRAADSVIAELTTRADLEAAITKLEEDLRRIEAEKSIRYVPSERKLKNEVIDALARLRKEVERTEAELGPSLNMLREIEATMMRHEGRSEYKLVLDTFSAIEPQMPLAEKDPVRRGACAHMRELATRAATVIEFEKLEIRVGGVAIVGEGQPVALINGRPLAVGDMLDSEVLIHAIGPEEIEFIYRGVIFARRY